MRREDIPLFSVDTHRSADEFDVIAFNLSAELVYTNVLNCVDLAGVPVRSADRTAGHPLVGAGGHATYNPEPLADFLDFVVLGDGEEVVGEINAAVQRVEGRWSAPTASTSCGPWPASRACTSPASTRPATCPTGASRPRCRSTRPPRPSSRSAPSPTWPTGPTRSASSCPSPRSCTTGSTSRSSAAAPAAAASARPA